MQAFPDRGATAPANSTISLAAAPTDHDLTVLVPAFNEQSRLGPTLHGLETFLDRTAIDYRVVVCDDGSTDNTPRLTDTMGRRFSTHSLRKNQGKGAAVRAGMLAATGAVVAFTDADLPYDLHALVEGYSQIRLGKCEIIFGARDMRGATMQAPRRLSRRLATATFSHIVATLISRKVTDTQCGLKVFSRQAAVEIFSRTTIDGFAFDAEVVYLSRRMGIPFERIPVTLINEYSSTLSLTRHALPMLADVARIRYRHASLPRYRRVAAESEVRKAA